MVTSTGLTTICPPYLLWGIRFYGSYGRPQGPPKYQGRSHFRPNAAMKYLLLGILMNHYTKNRAEILEIQRDFRISKF